MKLDTVFLNITGRIGLYPHVPEGRPEFRQGSNINARYSIILLKSILFQVVAISSSESLNGKEPEKLAFRWTYISLPAGLFVVSVILAAIFYGQIPAEAAYHFSGGEADRWVSRGGILAWTLVPQLVLLIIGAGLSAGVVWLGRRGDVYADGPMGRLMLAMGNMVALPQLILFFAMMDIFLYNAYEIHLMPLWIFALIVIVVGSVFLCVVLAQAIRQSRTSKD